MSQKHLVFVYGTLKTSQPNNYLLKYPVQGFGKLVSSATTLRKYPLIIASKYNIPYLLDKPGTGYRVVGEVYEVNDDMLANLDELEEHPTYYQRRLERIQMPADLEHPQLDADYQLTCWVYFLRSYKPELLKHSFIEDYDSRGSHGLPYVERYRRTLPGYNPIADVQS